MWLGLLFPLIFLTLGLAFLGYPGLEDDEVLFTTPFFHLAGASVYDMTLAQRKIPLMLLSYLGTLKAALYLPILCFFEPSVLTIRLPVLLLGCATIWLLYRFLEMIHGPRAAWIGGLLVATHATFLMTTVYDWGPVALQNLLLAAGMLLLAAWWKTPKWWCLFVGFLCFGLAMWDKALFAWVLSGISIAAVVVFPREVFRSLRWRNVAVAVAGFCLGALPLIKYNVSSRSRLATFHSNASFAFNEFPHKFLILRRTFNGSALLGYMSAEPWSDHARAARGAVEHVSYAIQSVFGEHRASYSMEAAFCLGLLLVPFLWRTSSRRILLFSLIATAIAWLQMAITANAGSSAHHAILIAPLAFIFLAVGLAQTSLRFGRVIAVVLVLLVGENLVVTNQNLFQFANYGSLGVWSDAIYALADEVERTLPTQVVVDDWGIQNALTVLENGRLPMVTVSEEFLAPGLNENQRAYYVRLLENGLWLGHTTEYRVFTGVSDRIDRGAEEAGFRKETVRIVPDSHGRAVFEVFRFVRRE
jgi:hypothetical protein